VAGQDKRRKLSDEQYEEVARMLRDTEHSFDYIASLLGVSKGTVLDINAGRHFSRKGGEKIRAEKKPLLTPKCSCGMMLFDGKCVRCAAVASQDRPRLRSEAPELDRSNLFKSLGAISERTQVAGIQRRSG
jgi:hypothetical protein